MVEELVELGMVVRYVVARYPVVVGSIGSDWGRAGSGRVGQGSGGARARDDARLSHGIAYTDTGMRTGPDESCHVAGGLRGFDTVAALRGQRLLVVVCLRAAVRAAVRRQIEGQVGPRLIAAACGWTDLPCAHADDRIRVAEDRDVGASRIVAGAIRSAPYRLDRTATAAGSLVIEAIRNAAPYRGGREISVIRREVENIDTAWIPAA